MRLPFAFLLICAALAFPLGFQVADAETFSPLTAAPSPQPGLVQAAKFVCGTFDGKYSCRYEQGIVPSGKDSFPKPRSQAAPSDGGQAPPEYGNTLTAPAPATESPPSSGGKCPKNSELLGGSCVRYSATCRPAVPVGVNPEPCARDDEQLVCKTGGDGSKSCCCRLYER
jgi:hypothetical protein